MVLDFESTEAAEPVSDVLDVLLDLSSFSALLSTSIGSSLSSFPFDPFVLSETSVIFFVAASTDTLSSVPLVLDTESFEVTEKGSSINYKSRTINTIAT